MESQSQKQDNDDLKDLHFNKMLTIEIIDTGLGIDEEHQQYLFVPFSELMAKQDINLVKNENIGLGLTCSSVIIQKLGGSIKLLESQKNNITVFQVEMPVCLDLSYIEEISLQSNLWSKFQHKMLYNFERPLNQHLLEYVHKNIDKNNYNLENIAKAQVNFMRDNPNISQSGKICQNQSNDLFDQDDNQSLVSRMLSDYSD